VRKPLTRKKFDKKEFVTIALPILSFIASIIALIISFYSNHISQQNLELVQESDKRTRILQKPLMRAAWEFKKDKDSSDNMVLNIFNDGPVLTDFKVEPKRFLLVDNKVLIPTDLQPEMWGRSKIGSSQGLITTLNYVSVYDFDKRFRIPEDSVYINTEDRFWDITDYNILLKITYSDVFHEDTKVYLFLSQTQLVGKYVASNDAELLIKQINTNSETLVKKYSRYTKENLIQIVKDINSNKDNLIKLDSSVFNRIPFKYSTSAD
jgi:hypothetical protein